MFSKRMVSSTPPGGAEVGVDDSQTPVHDSTVSVKQTFVGESPPSSTSTPTNSSPVELFASAKVATGGSNDRDGGFNSQNSAKRNAAPMGVASGIEKRRKASVAVPKSSVGQHKQSRLLGFFKPRDDESQKEQKIIANTDSAISSPTENMEHRVEGNETQSDGGASAISVGSEGPCPPAEHTRKPHPVEL